MASTSKEHHDMGMRRRCWAMDNLTTLSLLRA